MKCGLKRSYCNFIGYTFSALPERNYMSEQVYFDMKYEHGCRVEYNNSKRSTCNILYNYV